MNHQEHAARDRGDDVRRLIRLAGRRPSVPADRAARVRAAARQEWVGLVRRRRNRRFLWMGATLAAAAASLTLFVTVGRRAAPGPVPAPSFLIESVAGSAWPDDTTDGVGGFLVNHLRENDRVPFGTTLVTGEEGRLALRLATTGSVRLDAGSRLRVIDADTLEIQRGAVYVDSGDEGADVAAIVVRTPFGPVREIGTQFEVRLTDPGVRVRVREGSVEVEAAGAVHAVPAAVELTLEATGKTERRAIPVDGEIWEWVVAIASLPDMEGLSARAFLDHVAREHGWRLRFADGRTEREADRITLGGSFDRLSLADALDAVLPTCGMEHEVAGGALIVRMADEGS